MPDHPTASLPDTYHVALFTYHDGRVKSRMARWAVILDALDSILLGADVLPSRQGSLR